MVYIFENNEHFFKIGFSKNPKKRIKQLNTGNSSELKIIKTYDTTYCSKVESYLKNYFKLQKIRGEWFDLSDDDINKIEGLIKSKEFALRCVLRNSV